MVKVSHRGFLAWDTSLLKYLKSNNIYSAIGAGEGLQKIILSQQNQYLYAHAPVNNALMISMGYNKGVPRLIPDFT